MRYSGINNVLFGGRLGPSLPIKQYGYYGGGQPEKPGSLRCGYRVGNQSGHHFVCRRRS